MSRLTGLRDDLVNEGQVNDSSESKRQNQEAEMFEEFDLKTREGVEALLRVSPVHNLFEFELCDLNPETGALSIRAKTTGDAARAYGAEQVHGGVIATLIDCTATFACSVALNHTVPTMGLHIDFLRPAQGGRNDSERYSAQVGPDGYSRRCRSGSWGEIGCCRSSNARERPRIDD